MYTKLVTILTAIAALIFIQPAQANDTSDLDGVQVAAYLWGETDEVMTKEEHDMQMDMQKTYDEHDDHTLRTYQEDEMDKHHRKMRKTREQQDQMDRLYNE